MVVELNREARRDPDAKRVYRPNELRGPYGLTRDIVYKLIASGELKSYSIGRARFITVSAIEEMIAKRQEQSGS